jgi:DNA-binding SARP family transcriptional activator
MTRTLRIAKGVCALVALVALVGGIPFALWHFVGWPLPHHVPSAAAVGRALDRQGIPAQALVDALAVVVWLAWASLVASVAVEIPAAVAGRHARRLPVAGVFQPAAGRLVAAVVVAGLSLAPRPAAHPGPLAARLPTPAGRPPAAVVLAAVTTSAPPSTPSPAPALSATSSLVSTPVRETTEGTAAATRVYVVQRGDTLWGIAERELGDPLAWSQIYQLNVGRPQPGGATLTDPHWIYAGWTLLLPTSAPAAPASPPPSPPAAQPEPPPVTPREPAPPVPAQHATAPPPSATRPPTTAPGPATAAPALANGHMPAGPHQPDRHHQTGAPGDPVPLPSGSVVAGSFAAGVLSALAAGRLRRRHTYRYRPPRPGRDLTPAPMRPTLAHLVQAVDEQREPAGDQPPWSPQGPVGTDAATPPRHVDLARRGAETIAVTLDELSGLALSGLAADDAARALVATLVVGAGPGQADALLAGDAAGRLLPGVEHPAIRRAPSADTAARMLEAERIARTRRLDAAGAANAERFRLDNPENPLPVLLALCDGPAAETAGRWAALAADAPRLGIAVVYLVDTPAATARVVTDEHRQVASASPASLAGRLAGAELFGLTAAEAAELLGTVTDSLADEPEPDGDAGIDADITVLDGHSPAKSAADGEVGEPWPEPPGPDTPGVRPIRVQLFGHLAVFVHGEAVADGLRSRAKMLLAWYLLCPEGATSEQAVDALWPDTTPDQVGRQFWRAFGDLRTRLRDAGGDGLDVLVKAGDHYQPATAEIACDLWDFQAALAEAARAGADNDEAARAALRRAVELYRGDLAEGCDWLWVEPARADLHRRALDAHLRLAELEVAAGRPDAAQVVLERAIDLDRYGEDPYRRLMALQAETGRTEALRDTWQLLNRRLGELDLEVEAQTARLYQQLTDETAAGLRHAGLRR